jgi:hypothetical protein
MRTIDKIITEVNCKYGAPMGRPNVGTFPGAITSGPNGREFKCNQKKVFDCRVPMCSGDPSYDKGGAYWGLPPNLRVRYTKDLTFVQFYRTNNKPF